MLNPSLSVAVFSACFGIIYAQCTTGISTNRTHYSTGAYITLVGESTFIECSLSCTCTPEFIYWLKDGESVYSRWWIPGGTTGPVPPFEGRVNPDLIENNGSYVLEWNQTLWDDLSSSQATTNWMCSYQLSPGCGSPTRDMDLEYFESPVPYNFSANTEPVEDNCDKIMDIEDGTLNCAVLSRPGSNVSLWWGTWQGDGSTIPGDSSCSLYSDHQSICSVSVGSVPFRLGFYCVAEYVSPESGAIENIGFDGCGPLPGINSGGLEPWAIAVISVSSAIVVGAIICVALQLTGVVNIRGMCKAGENVSQKTSST